ncbi:MAG: C40 family peptidase [Verrucomicrobia bacterium]|nr:C40 family peptidase [Verrucomicrobiota bacterium]
MYVFRHTSVLAQPIAEAISKLEGKTSYRRPARLEEAPLITDCLTSIHYLFKHALKINIPLTYIGDMPRRLLSYSEWRAVKIDIKDAKCGDLLFVKSREREKLVSHVAMVIETDKIFHCCLNAGTAIVQSEEEFFSLYEQRLDFVKMIRYIDPRNRELRDLHQGIFMQS